MRGVQVKRPRSVSDVVSMLSGVVIPTFVALKLAGVITWSWWWVLSPIWIQVAIPILLVSGLFIAWCLASWLFIIVNLFRRRRPPRPLAVISLHGIDADPHA